MSDSSAGDSRAVGGHSVEQFDAMYAETPPWDIGRPQPAFLQLAEADDLRGRVLDIGCGTGEHALMAAGLGLTATGVDASPTAIGIARRKAEERKLEARFIVANALDLTALGEDFDTVLDCGLFHVFDDNDRARYVATLHDIVGVGGAHYMLCFSDRQPGDWGPRRVSQAEIRSAFADGWRVASIDAATIDITISPDCVQAWRSKILRV
jgi:cyclopropane fatty-acyl-phospholipid synthase-like methyltransferase